MDVSLTNQGKEDRPDSATGHSGTHGDAPKAKAGKEGTRLVVFASGNGSNADRLMQHFKGHPTARVVLLVCNKPNAPVLSVAARHKVPSLVVGPMSWQQGQDLVDQLRSFQADALVLAGFLWKIPGYLLQAFPDRIVNLHPALLPDFGGKGMYGMQVHQAVLASGRHESGITVHLVNEEYDRGRHLARFVCPVLPEDQPQDLAKRVQALEHRHYPEVLEAWIGDWA